MRGRAAGGAWVEDEPWRRNPDQDLSPDPDTSYGPLRLALEQDEVVLAFQKPAEQIDGEVTVYLQRHARIGARKAGQHVLQMRGCEILRRAKPYCSGDVGIHQTGTSLIAEPKDLAGIGQQDLAVRRELKLTSRLPFEDAVAEPVFQLLDLEADG